MPRESLRILRLKATTRHHSIYIYRSVWMYARYIIDTAAVCRSVGRVLINSVYCMSRDAVVSCSILVVGPVFEPYRRYCGHARRRIFGTRRWRRHTYILHVLSGWSLDAVDGAIVIGIGMHETKHRKARRASRVVREFRGVPYDERLRSLNWCTLGGRRLRVI